TDIWVLRYLNPEAAFYHNNVQEHLLRTKWLERCRLVPFLLPSPAGSLSATGGSTYKSKRGVGIFSLAFALARNPPSPPNHESGNNNILLTGCAMTLLAIQCFKSPRQPLFASSTVHLPISQF
ncbi:hypothetical protein C7M84_022012, partial [Penaeus vannamei]